MEEVTSTVVSAVIAQVQLLSDLNELCCDIYGGDTDDEDNVVTIAAKTGLLSSSSDNERNVDEPFGLHLASSESSKNGSKLKKVEDNYSIGYAEITVGLYTEFEFRQQFHMSRRTVECLCRKLVPLMLNAIAPHDNPIRSGRPSIRLEKKILITLWHLANHMTFRIVAERFEVSTSTVEDSLRRTVTALVNMAGEYIYWPVADYAEDNKQYFKELTKLQGAIGVLGIARIRIKTVKETPKIYADNKIGGYTVTVQFVCDKNLRFTDCYAGLPGGSSDTNILKTSDLYSRATTDRASWFPNNSFVIGGLSFPLESWLITPFVDNGNLSKSKKLFNDSITNGLLKMLETLALLRGRFQRLNMLELGRLDYLPICVSASFVLHNFCLEEEHDEINHIQDYIDAGMNMVLEDYGSLTNYQINETVVDEVSDIDNWIQGCEFRNSLCNNLNIHVSN